jgi:serine/threonine-protein kinase RsbW
MRMKIALWLPRTADSVSLARQVLDRIFASFGVRPDCREEIALAVSEACSNVVRHADGAAMYHLAAESTDRECTIVVDDDGPGLASPQSTEMPAVGTTGGRGFALMRTLSDRVEVRRRQGGGLSVRLFKNLRWRPGAPGAVVP